tara:strand:- start:321 stop:599 length:279 start_codon:yes stop_codon:yes gene_type:complete
MYNRKLTNIAKNLIEVELKYYELRRLPIVKEYNQIASLRKDVRKNTSSYMEANKIFSYSLQKQMADLTLTFQNGYPIPDHFKLKVDYKKGVK